MSPKTTLELLEDNLNKHMEICELNRKVERLEAEVKRLRAQAAIQLPNDTGLNGALSFAIDAIINQKKEGDK